MCRICEAGVGIGNRDSMELPIVHAEPKRAICLLDKDNGGSPWTGRFSDDTFVEEITKQTLERLTLVERKTASLLLDGGRILRVDMVRGQIAVTGIVGKQDKHVVILD